MPELKLFLFPGACSRVSLTALEQCGAAYEAEMIDLLAGEHMRPAYQATNPRGKVPALLVEGKLLSENAAILRWLNATWPEAGLFPTPADDWEAAQQMSDLFWLSSVWHPYVRANRAPSRWTVGDEAPVRARGKELLAGYMAQLEKRLADRQWWYGNWSILDVYFYWAYTTAETGEFDLSPYPRVAEHRGRVEALPALQRALARERDARERHG